MEGAAVTAPVEAPQQNQGPDLQALAQMAFMEDPSVRAAAPVAQAAPVEAPIVNQQDDVVDADLLVKEHFGLDGGLEALRSEWENLQNLKKNPPVAEHKFANDEARKWYDYFISGKEDELREKLNARSTVAGLDTMNDEQKLKLFIKMNNPLYDQELVDAVFSKNYSFKESDFKDEDGNITDPLAYRLAKVDALQKMQSDLSKAGEYFAQYKSKIELPPIQAQQQADESYETYKASNAKSVEDYNTLIAPALKGLSENDVPLSFSINDANNQMQFDVNLAIEKNDFEDARKRALSYSDYLSEAFYDKDGKFQANKLIRAIALEKNFDKYAQSIARQAVNAERRRIVNKETPVVNMEKNFTVEENDRIKEIEKYVFAGVNVK